MIFQSVYQLLDMPPFLVTKESGGMADLHFAGKQVRGRVLLQVIVSRTRQVAKAFQAEMLFTLYQGIVA